MWRRWHKYFLILKYFPVWRGAPVSVRACAQRGPGGAPAAARLELLPHPWPGGHPPPGSAENIWSQAKNISSLATLTISVTGYMAWHHRGRAIIFYFRVQVSISQGRAIFIQKRCLMSSNWPVIIFLPSKITDQYNNMFRICRKSYYLKTLTF